MKIISFGGTDRGKKRSNNEDAYLIDDRIGLFVVADGIGGSEGGEVASRIGVDALAKTIRGGELSQSLHEAGSENLLRQAITIANTEILHAREQRPELSAMGTTVAALLIRDDFACIAHVGDSRVYLFRSGELTQLTNDHSFVAEQLQAGVMTPEQARSSPYRHVITRALGTNSEVLPDVALHRVQKDDKFLLCTDGLTEMVEDEDIGRIIGHAAPREAVQQLLAAANEQGGVDNITAIVVWVAEG